ncbi:MAG: hypothetical protein KDD55_11590 [Bdellovibrionales bacterium]|nr:hypothetical protein [Bdellovibrionales bacterium]
MKTNQLPSQTSPVESAVAEVPNLNVATLFSHDNNSMHPDAHPVGKVIAHDQHSRQALQQGVEALLEHLDKVMEYARLEGLEEIAVLDIGPRNIRPTTLLSRLGNACRFFTGEEATIELRDPIFRQLWNGIVERGYTPVLQEGKDHSPIAGEAFLGAYRIAVKVPAA